MLECCGWHCVVAGLGGFPEGHWLPDPIDGCRVRQLLHEGGDVDPHPRVSVPRWGDEEDCAQGEGNILLKVT